MKMTPLADEDFAESRRKARARSTMRLSLLRALQAFAGTFGAKAGDD
jgi:hypothetical protein